MLRSALGFLALVLFTPALLFATAGTLDWPMGWAYVAVSTLGTGGAHLLVAWKHPDNLRERAKGLRGEGTQSWDRTLVPLIIWGSVITLTVAGVDHRLGWSRVASLDVQVGALIVIAAGYALASWAMAENRFFAITVRLQTDRGQVVVSGGPYRLVRHPGYAGSVAATLCVPLALGSAWALAPAVLTVMAIVIRTALEDRFLRENLEGYAAFTERTRWRVLPGVW